MNSDLVFSCVVDSKYKFQIQSQYWATTLIKLGQISPNNIVIYTISDLDPDLDAWFRRLGVNICPINGYPGHAYCNKLQQLDSLLDGFDSKYFVLMDCDTAVSRHLSSLPRPSCISAKRVETANPPTKVISKVFGASGLGEPKWVNAYSLPGRDGILTDINNCNGGVYIVNRDFLKKVSPIWKKWANWCIAHEDLFEQYSMHIDQVSLAMAMKEMSIDIEPLPGIYNVSTNISIDVNNDLDAHIVHYHWMLDNELFLKKIGLPKIDSSISRINDCLRQSRNDLFLNSIFFGARYELFPQLGSGIGSRGNDLSYKQHLLRTLVNDPQPTVLDVGFGDLEVSHCLPTVDYLGIETTSACIDMAKKLRPDWEYIIGDIRKMQFSKRDIVICLDVLIHQPTYDLYLQLSKYLCDLAVDTVIVGAYDCEPAYTSSITFYYEPISVTLKKLHNFTEISVVGKYRDISMIVARKRPPLSHKRDLSPEDFNIMSIVTDYPLLLRVLVDKSRDAFGFFAAHTPRCLEYPWILSCLPDKMNGISVLDVGAGVNPVPLVLADRGANVFTVDNHALRRDLSQKQDLNEWGYLDYSVIESRIQSINTAYETFSAMVKFDVIYSVSVIEHVTASMRRTWIDKFAHDMKTGATLLLTVDLIPETNFLWYFAEERIVEAKEIHGTLEGIKDELICAGFIVDECITKRNLKNCRVDTGFIRARLGGVASLHGHDEKADLNRSDCSTSIEAKSSSMETDIENANKRIVHLINARDEIMKRLIHVEKNRVELVSSFSWQVTRPMRYLAGLLSPEMRRFGYRVIGIMWQTVTFSWLRKLRERRVLK